MLEESSDYSLHLRIFWEQIDCSVSYFVINLANQFWDYAHSLSFTKSYEIYSIIILPIKATLRN